MVSAECVPCITLQMENLGFYPLTIILSFLTEKEGVSVLISKQKFAAQILPIFRQQQPLNNDTDCCKSIPNHNNNDAVPGRKHYRFKASPVQDPDTLLDRLNSRRLYKRRRHIISQVTTTKDTSNLTTSEIARLEWQQQYDQSDRYMYPPTLELLRFKVLHKSNRTTSGRAEFQNLDLNYSTQNKITLLVSYPRSGNTLLRTLLERTTGYVTGSDTRPDRSLSKELAEQHNLIGEGVVAANRVVYVKTHYPERIGHRTFNAQSAIILVRNPYDAIDSYWNMNATKSHTKSLLPDMYEQHRNMWCGLVRNEVHVWNKFLEFWLNEDCPIPVIVVRFEDLIRNPSYEMQRILEFTIRQNQIEQNQQQSDMGQLVSKYWMSRIHHCTRSSSNTDQLGSYQPRSATSGISSVGRALRTGHYTDELIDYIHEVCAMNYSENYLRRFGYDVKTQGFPANFINSESSTTIDSSAFSMEEDKTRISNNSQCTDTTLLVNHGIPIRPINCPYGRLLQQWRHSVTDNDRIPLPTKPK